MRLEAMLLSLLRGYTKRRGADADTDAELTRRSVLRSSRILILTCYELVSTDL